MIERLIISNNVIAILRVRLNYFKVNVVGTNYFSAIDKC